MHFLRSILLVSAAFATVASAIPTTPATEDGATGIDSDLDNLKHYLDLSTELTDGLNSNRHTGQDEGVHMTERGQLYVPSESFQKCSGGIALVIVKIKSACGGDHSKVDHNVVIGLLREILALLGTLLFELKGGDYNGCDVNVLADLLAGLLITLAEVIALVIGVVGTVDKVLCGVIADIAALLCVILRLVFGLVDGLLAAVVVLLVSPFADHCQTAGLLSVLAILGL